MTVKMRNTMTKKTGKTKNNGRKKGKKSMSCIVLASNNRKKIAEIETLLGDLTSQGTEVKSLRDIGYTDDIDEWGSVFEENSLIKARVPADLGYIGIADDSGLAVDFLGGAPGIHSARYAGEHGNDAKNREKLLHELKDVPEEQRGAKFVCTCALVLPEGSPYSIPEEWRITDGLSEKTGIPKERAMVVRGECRGVILEKEQGDGGFGYDPLFWYPEFGHTFAEIPGEMKNRVSHRGNAMGIFIPRLIKILAR